MTDAVATFTVPISERYEIGRVVSRTTQIISRHVPIFTLLSTICCFVPGIFVGAARFKMTAAMAAVRAVNPVLNSARESLALQSMGTAFAFLFCALLSLFGILYLQAAVVGTVFRDLQGSDQISPLRAAWRHILPLLGITILLCLASVCGLVLLIVPGVLIGLAFCMAVPVRVAESRGVFGAMQRSRDLTRGCRWRLFLTFLVLFGVGAALGAVAAILDIIFHAPALVRTVFVTPLVNAVSTLIATVGLAVIYCELRAAKEGGSTSEVVEAFT